MKTTKSAVILLALVLLTAATVQSAEKPAEKELSNTRTASCLLKITTSEAVLPLNEFAVDYLLRSSGVAGKAARDVLDIPPDIASELFTCEEIYSIDAGPYGGVGVPSGTTSGASSSYSYYYGTPTTTSSRSTTTRRPTTTRTPVPAQISKTPTSPSARPKTPSTASSISRYARTTPTRTTARRTPTKAVSPGATAGEQILLIRLSVEFSGALNTIMSNIMGSDQFLPGPGQKIDIDEYIKPAAEEFMNALIENLYSALNEAFTQHHNKLNNQIHLAETETKLAEIDLMNMQNDLREISDSRDLNRHAIHNEINILRQKLQNSKMNRASDETLYEATTKQIAETQAKRQTLAENDTITKELESILAVHETRLKEVQALYNRGDASLADTQDAKEKIIRARIELAQRREQILNPEGSTKISSLNNELASIATNMALAEQEVKSLAEQLEEAKDLLKIADKYELLSLKADIARQSLEETLLWQARLGRNMRLIRPPDVTVIGAE